MNCRHLSLLALTTAILLSSCASPPDYQAPQTADYYSEHPDFTRGKVLDCMAAATLQVMAEKLPATEAAARRREILTTDPQCTAARNSYNTLGRAGRLKKISQSELAVAMRDQLLDNPAQTRALSLDCYREAYATMIEEKIPQIYLANRLEELLASSPRCALVSSAYEMLKEKGRLEPFSAADLGVENIGEGSNSWGEEGDLDGWNFDKKKEQWEDAVW